MTKVVYFSMEQFCRTVPLPQEHLFEIIELGIIDPIGADSGEWQFNIDMVCAARRAFQLHQQLEVDWPGIALALQLLDQIDDLKNQNQNLRQRLARFVEDV